MNTLCPGCDLLGELGKRPRPKCIDCRACAGVFALADRVGVPLADRQPTPWQWDGNEIAIRHIFTPSLRRDAYDVLHEIAHFQIAPKCRVRIPDFGLGPGVLSAVTASPIPPAVHPTYANEEDNRATVLALAHAHAIDGALFATLLRRLPIPFATWADVARDLDWRGEVRWLERRGLIVEGKGTARNVRGEG